MCVYKYEFNNIILLPRFQNMELTYLQKPRITTFLGLERKLVFKNFFKGQLS